MRALVLSISNHRGAFAAIRHLNQAGWIVSAGTSDPKGLVSWSRATRAVYTVPPPERGYEPFLAAVAAAVRASGAEVVLPSDDGDLMALSLGREQIPTIVPLAPHPFVARLVDKLELMDAARSAGLAAPETRLADADGLRESTYPVIVKPRFHWRPDHKVGAPGRLTATVCNDSESAAAVSERLRTVGALPVLQEFIEGEPVSIHLVADESGVLSLAQQESPSMLFPPRTGIRVRSIVVPTDPVLATGVRRLVADNGWLGLAGLTFLRGADGIPRIIDFNGRITGSIEAVAGAGPNYVAAWAAVATGREVGPIPDARVGTRTQWLEGDLRRALREQRGGLLRDIWDCLGYSIGANHTVLKRDEPYALLRHTATQLRRSQVWQGRPGRGRQHRGS